MTENLFYNKLVQSVEYGNYENKNELINILKNSYITFNKTNLFATKSWQCWEKVEIRVPIPFLETINIHEKYLESICYDIYEESDEYDIRGIEIKPGKIIEELDEVIKKEVHFEDIQQKIISNIKNAQYTIWVAVAWFTDEVLFNELILKKKQGLNIQIIINDDEINNKYGCSFENYFETYRIPTTGFYNNNIMHNKFCIIDLKTVIHGSYNWSKKAQYNQETVTIDEDSKVAKQFADKFITLKAASLS